MQQLCTLPKFGGVPGQSAGGWCFTPGPDFGYLAFDTKTANNLLLNPRVMLACSFRCWCVRDALGQFWSEGQPFLSRNNAEVIASDTFEISIEKVDDFESRFPDNLGAVWEDFLTPPSHPYTGEMISRGVLPLPQNMGSGDEPVSSSKQLLRDYVGDEDTYNSPTAGIHALLISAWTPTTISFAMEDRLGFHCQITVNFGTHSRI